MAVIVLAEALESSGLYKLGEGRGKNHSEPLASRCRLQGRKDLLEYFRRCAHSTELGSGS